MPIYKLEWQCAKCKVWHRDQSYFEVDHIKEIGEFKGDWHEYVMKVYCRQTNLQLLCAVCHKKKTSGFNASLMFERKKRGD